MKCTKDGKFKIGDRVVRKKSAGSHGRIKPGKGGIITDIDSVDQVRLDDATAWHMSRSVELVVQDSYTMY